MFVLRDACLPGFAADNRAGGHAPPDRLQTAHKFTDAPSHAVVAKASGDHSDNGEHVFPDRLGEVGDGAEHVARTALVAK